MSNGVITHHDATQACMVLECFIKGTKRPTKIDRDAVERVRMALLHAIFAEGEHSSVVIMTRQEG